jgi:hypothetical protein
MVDSSPNDVSSLRTGQWRVTILLAPSVRHDVERYRATHALRILLPRMMRGAAGYRAPLRRAPFRLRFRG